MNMNIIAFFSLFLVALFQLVSSSPILAQREQMNELVVWSPEITYPTNDTVWQAGSTYNMTWETSNMPRDAARNNGTVMLGYLEGDDNDEENLDYKHPLAKGFLLKQGWIDFTIPENVTERTNYVVALLGDSGNLSKKFTIKAAHH